MSTEADGICEPTLTSLREVISAEQILQLIKEKGLELGIKEPLNRKNLEEWSIRHNLMHVLPDLVTESTSRKNVVREINTHQERIGVAVCGLFEFDLIFNVYSEEVKRVDYDSMFEAFHPHYHELPGNFLRLSELEFEQCLVYRTRALKCALAGENAVSMTLLRSSLESAVKGALYLCMLSPKIVDKLDIRKMGGKISLSELASDSLDVNDTYFQTFEESLELLDKTGVMGHTLRSELKNKYRFMSGLTHSDPIYIMAVLSDSLRVKSHNEDDDPVDFSNFIPNLKFSNDFASYLALSILDLIFDNDLIKKAAPVKNESPPMSLLFYAGDLNRTKTAFEKLVKD